MLMIYISRAKIYYKNECFLLLRLQFGGQVFWNCRLVGGVVQVDVSIRNHHFAGLLDFQLEDDSVSILPRLRNKSLTWQDWRGEADLQCMLCSSNPCALIFTLIALNLSESLSAQAAIT